MKKICSPLAKQKAHVDLYHWKNTGRFRRPPASPNRAWVAVTKVHSWSRVGWVRVQACWRCNQRCSCTHHPSTTNGGCGLCSYGHCAVMKSYVTLTGPTECRQALGQQTSLEIRQVQSKGVGITAHSDFSIRVSVSAHIKRTRKQNVKQYRAGM